MEVAEIFARSRRRETTVMVVLFQMWRLIMKYDQSEKNYHLLIFKFSMLVRKYKSGFWMLGMTLGFSLVELLENPLMKKYQTDAMPRSKRQTAKTHILRPNGSIQQYKSTMSEAVLILMFISFRSVITRWLIKVWQMQNQTTIGMITIIIH